MMKRLIDCPCCREGHVSAECRETQIDRWTEPTVEVVRILKAYCGCAEFIRGAYHEHGDRLYRMRLADAVASEMAG